MVDMERGATALGGADNGDLFSQFMATAAAAAALAAAATTEEVGQGGDPLFGLGSGS